MTKRQEERVAQVLFRESKGTKCDFVRLSKRTGIPLATLYRYREHPESMPFGRFLVIAKEMCLTADESGYLVTGKKS